MQIDLLKILDFNPGLLFFYLRTYVFRLTEQAACYRN